MGASQLEDFIKLVCLSQAKTLLFHFSKGSFGNHHILKTVVFDYYDSSVSQSWGHAWRKLFPCLKTLSSAMWEVEIWGCEYISSVP